MINSRKSATTNIPQLIGRVKNTDGSPREINMARRRFSSINGPSTKPSSSGPGSQPHLLEKYLKNPYNDAS